MIIPSKTELCLCPSWLPAWHRPLRIPSWPPEADWVVSEDREGGVISSYGDDYWDFGLQAGRVFKLNFTGTQSRRKIEILGAENAELLRRVITWRMWGSRDDMKLGSIKGYFGSFRRLFVFCERNGILASELMRFPSVFEKLPQLFAPGAYSEIVHDLQRLWDVRDQIGFVIVDGQGIARLKSMCPDRNEIQTPYIPPRIWAYQLGRLKELVTEFMEHKERIRDCFNFCLSLYENNFGLNMYSAVREKSRNPFQNFPENAGSRTNVRYLGGFDLTAERFGIKKLIDRWIDPGQKDFSIRCFSSYMSLVQAGGLGLIANFSLQRIGEVSSLRADCLQWDKDPEMGRVPIIRGEVTKAIPESDARWIAHPYVEVAIDAMNVVACLRMQCAEKNPIVKPSSEDINNPYLFDRGFEPWGCGPGEFSYETRPSVKSYSAVLKVYSKLLDINELRINAEDIDIAKKLTPGLREKDGFKVGEPWPLAWHQLRRTGAVNMTASGIVSDTSLQFQLKHSSRMLSMYYGRGHARLKLNREVAAMVYSAVHENMVRAMLEASGERFVSPLGEARRKDILVQLVGVKDIKKLAKAAEKGLIMFRETRLGACAKQGSCEYGGVESVARCAGGDGRDPCADALFDRAKESAVANELAELGMEVAQMPDDSPLRRASEAEVRSMENFLNVVRH